MSIPLLGAATYTVTRPGTAGYTNGLPTNTAAAVLTIRASIQPMTGDELQRASEGLRATHGVKIYASRTLILRTVESVGPQADFITYDGRVYQIQRVQPYVPNAPIAHVRYEAFATETGRKIQGQP
jgi:hypothetical protein